jgi:hypothetical protein
MKDNANGIIGATAAVRTIPIPAEGRRIYYRGYLIHAEIPGICYVVYGRNSLGQLAELGTVRSFTDAMQWVDRHIDEMRDVKTLVPEAAANQALLTRRAVA